MPRVRIWVDGYWKRDEHGRKVHVRGHWKIIEVKSGRPIDFRFPKSFHPLRRKPSR